MHVGVDADYIGDRVDSDRGFPVAQNVATGNYTLWNLNFGTKIRLEDIELSINAKNIFDKEYQSTYNYATAGTFSLCKITTIFRL